MPNAFVSGVIVIVAIVFILEVIKFIFGIGWGLFEGSTKDAKSSTEEKNGS